jgi:hypothetical protein
MEIRIVIGSTVESFTLHGEHLTDRNRAVRMAHAQRPAALRFFQTEQNPALPDFTPSAIPFHIPEEMEGGSQPMDTVSGVPTTFCFALR